MIPEKCCSRGNGLSPAPLKPRALCYSVPMGGEPPLEFLLLFFLKNFLAEYPFPLISWHPFPKNFLLSL